MVHCVGFDCDNVNFLHRSLYGAGVWISTGNSVDNTGKLLLLLSSTYTASTPFMLLQRGGWGCARSWEWTQAGQMTPNDQRDIPYHMGSFQYIKLREGENEDVQRDGVCPPKSQFHRMEPCFPGVDWTSAHPWEAMNYNLFSLLVFMAFALLLKCLYLNPGVSSLLLIQFSPLSHHVVNERAAAGV